MSVFQCRMCGGTLEVRLYSGVCKCSFCGTEQSVPRFGLSEKENLLRRAEQYRRCSDYDGALLLYEQALSLDPQDADIYWAMVLCRYGVDYVFDPQKKQHIPTINRTRAKAVSDDGDFRCAMKYADEYQRSVFSRQAEELDRIQNDILAQAETIQPFDIFLCYKESDSTGRRTTDSVIAGELYRKLIGEGYRVFFSRITLENVTGSAYEPYIYAALNSAKVMLLLATNPEYLCAPWVRNEWSRFLALSANSGRTLAVLSKNIAPEQLPDELRHLQMTDISKLGWEQDILHGLEKIVQRSSAGVTVVSSAGAAPLIRRARLFMEDKNFPRAVELCERALDQEPENAEAYFTRLMAELCVSTPEELCGLSADYTMNDSFRKAERFAAGELAGVVRKCGQTARFNRCKYEMLRAESSEQWNLIAETLEKIAGDADFDKTSEAQEMAEKCRQKAEQIREAEEVRRISQKLSSYELRISQSEDIGELQKIRTELQEINCGNSTELAERASERIAELSELLEYRQKAEISRKKRRRIIGISAAALCGAISVAGCTTLIVKQVQVQSKYSNAINLRESGEYDKALELFLELDAYRDSKAQSTETKYLKAVDLVNRGEYSAAQEILEQLYGGMVYKDSGEYLNRARYAQAEQSEENGEFYSAAESFAALGDYLDSAKRSKDCIDKLAGKYASGGEYIMAADIYAQNGQAELAREMRMKETERLVSEGSFISAREFMRKHGMTDAEVKSTLYSMADKLSESAPQTAAEVFDFLGNYSDSKQKFRALNYAEAVRRQDSGDLDGAAELFRELGEYSDSSERLNEVEFALAKRMISEGDSSGALSILERLGGYADSGSMLSEVRYNSAKTALENGEYVQAMNDFSKLTGYLDSDTLYLECAYQLGHQTMEAGSFSRAERYFQEAGDYSDSRTMLLEVKYRKALQLREEHMFDEADKLLAELGSYSDAAQKLAESSKVRLSSIRTGDQIIFGSYQQSKDPADGTAPLQWKCLEISDGTAFLIAVNCIDYGTFGADNWADSPMRSWLNNEFYNACFSQSEKARIVSVTNDNPDNLDTGAFGGGETTDRVFLPGRTDIDKYGISAAEPTVYAMEQERQANSAVAIRYGLAGYWMRSVSRPFKIDAMQTVGRSSPVEYDKGNYIRPCIRISIGE